MLKQLAQGVLKKQLWIKKSPAVQGAVCIHFHSKNVKDIILSNFDKVDVFQRINIQPEDIKKSNLQALLLRGDVQVVG